MFFLKEQRISGTTCPRDETVSSDPPGFTEIDLKLVDYVVEFWPEYLTKK